MQTLQSKISSLLVDRVQYILPMFQRPYSWEDKNWRKLWNDIKELISKEGGHEHFLGSMVVLQEDTLPGKPTRYSLIDGQQRLTTFSLILCALRDMVRHKAAILAHIDLELVNDIENQLINRREKEDYRAKIVPTQDDQLAYRSILNGTVLGKNSQLEQAYHFFYRQIEELLDRRSDKVEFLENLFRILSDAFVLVTIQLSKGENAYRIFESLNATGLALTQADLVRNYVFMRLAELTQEEQIELHAQYWRPIEQCLNEKRWVGKSNIGELTAFLRHYLATKTGELCNKSEVYFELRNRLDRDCPTVKALKVELKQLHAFANYYNKFLRPETEKSIIGQKLERLKRLENSTAFPFLLQVYADYERGNISLAEFSEVLSGIENYMVRRYLTRQPTNYLNKMFPLLYKEINPQQFVSSFKVALANHSYPPDRKILEYLPTLPLYGRSGQLEKLRLVLETIELSEWDNKEAQLIFPKEVSIEHIMPQSKTDAWQAEVGEDYERVFADLLNTMGNLTLTGHNSELSNRPYAQKRETLSTGTFKLNHYFAQVPRWNEAAIRERARLLTDKVLTCWPVLIPKTTVSQPPKSTTERPISITICEENWTVQNWRDVTHQVAEFVVTKSGDTFTDLAKKFPNYLKADPTDLKHRPRVLSNGWGVYVNLSGGATRKFCLNLLTAVGIPESELIIQTEA